VRRLPIVLALPLSLTGLAACGQAPHKQRFASGHAAASYELRLGRDVYQHNCLICHGTTGAGDGFNAYNLDPRPRDLSEPVFQARKTDAELADAIRRGGAGVGLSALMPPWGRTLSGRQIDDVILYLRALRRLQPSPTSVPPRPSS
jgi:mono/diheme cytochrome c family protein